LTLPTGYTHEVVDDVHTVVLFIFMLFQSRQICCD
jgi:hypothetical protein